MKRSREERPYYTPAELGNCCDLSQTTIWRAIKAGKIKAFQTPGGHFRIYPKEVKRILKIWGVRHGVN